jgi:arylsulfatase A
MRNSCQIIVNRLPGIFKYLLLLVYVVLTACSRKSDKETIPNFLVLLADDLGYGDLGCYGNDSIHTPNLDRLAQNGVKLTSFYASAPVCSPSRAGLLTGRIPSRAGIYEWISHNSDVHLPAGELTISSHLQQAGYQTALMGKWHLNGKFNSPDQPQPHDHGFEYWLATQNNASPSHENPENFVLNGQPVGQLEGYSCEIIANHAIEWLMRERDPSRPYFMYLSFHEPHEPVASPQWIIDKYYSHIEDPNRAQYYANVTNLDFAIGKVIDHLEQTGLINNTLVFFSSDNGPETLNRYPQASRSYGSPGPLSGMKLDLLEGGIRVPGIFRYDGVFPSGVAMDVPVSALDLFPMASNMANLELPDIALDGEDVSSILKGETKRRLKPLFWYYFSANDYQVALRNGDIKVLGTLEKRPDKAGYPFSNKYMEMITNNQLVDFAGFDISANPREQQEDQLASEVLKAQINIMDSIYRRVVSSSPVWN